MADKLVRIIIPGIVDAEIEVDEATIAAQVQTAITQSGGGLPDATSASVGDFLRLDSEKNAVWEAVPSVMGASIPLGN